MKNTIYTVRRKTSESLVRVTLDFNEFKEDYRKRIATPLPFLNHLIEHIAWRSDMNIEVEVQLDEFNLTHLVCEDVGITFGKVVAEYFRDNASNGVMGFGDGMAMIDEARAISALSFEHRTFFAIDYNHIEIPAVTEEMSVDDLETFLEGFTQGANCTFHVELVKGHNGHHIWEAIYRSFGVALNRALALNEIRKGRTSGVAGSISYEIEME
ncbi:hypothetical protein [Candidatus Formimonas warabiya]|uniref:Imidazoleglycerol-phosphate dehydratase n=1 Tax=Formimonas warabiya TaxID=1761012 RepID=A0A3G1KS38_FORW1|nr:hypothetical protein [Candidatus Formimonas warabiya]ATW24955.1 hypothetical protein DCMF_09375 [Candidatus Formimonas warabiya]